MRKLLFLTLLSLLAIGLFAQTTITIGNPASGTAVSAPVHVYWGYTVSQMIYTAQELSDAGMTAGVITNIMFQAHDTTIDLSSASSWHIRMLETPTATMASWINPTTLTQVFNGDIGISSLAAEQWIDITLQTPFVYTGTDNILIQVVDITAGLGSSGQQFRGHTTGGTDLMRYNTHDTVGYDPINSSGWETGSTPWTAARPNLRLTVAAPAIGTDLTVLSFTAPVQWAEITSASPPISITVMNLGTVAPTNYTLEIFEVAEPSNLSLYIEQDIVALTDPYDQNVYSIPYSEYETWDITGFGNVTLMAKVTSTPADAATGNDSKTFVIYNKPTTDIEVLSIAGLGTMMPTAHPFIVTLKNNGASSIVADTGTIKVYEVGAGAVETEIPLVTAISHEQIPAGATRNITIKASDLLAYSFTAVNDSTTIKVKVTLAGDQVPANDAKTRTLPFFNGTTKGIVEVGIGGTETTNAIPFNTNYHDNVTQSVYRYTELGGMADDDGIITHIMYKFTKISYSTPNPYPVNIYLANFSGREDGFDSVTNWVPQIQFTKVVENRNLSLATLATGTHEIWIELDTPFPYLEGSDLVVMTHKDLSSDAGSDTWFRTDTVANSNATLSKYRDTTGDEYDPEDLVSGNNANATRHNFKPQMRIAFLTESTDPDLAIRITGPALIPTASEEDIVLTVMNMSSAEDVVATDYKIEIYEVGDTDELLYTIDSADYEGDGINTVGILSGSFLTEEIVIPASVFNGWQYVGDGGEARLRADLTYLTETDAFPGNNTATLVTALRPVVDISFGTVTGPTIYPSFAPLRVPVQNNGRAAVTQGSYTLAITIAGTSFDITYTSTTAVAVPFGDSYEYVIASEIIAAELADASIATGPITFTFTLSGLAGDVAGNNTTTFSSSLSAISADGIVEVGIGGTNISYLIPFGSYYRDSVVQSIYKRSDFGEIESGFINQIMYKFRRIAGGGTNPNPDPFPVSIWMANVPEGDKPNGFTSVASSAWYPLSTFGDPVVEDYDLALVPLAPTPAPAAHDIWITLPEAFLYTGGDLVVMTWQDHNGYMGYDNVFLQSNDDPVTTNYWTISLGNDDTDTTSFPNIIPTSNSATRQRYVPQTRFAMMEISDTPDISITNFTGPAKIPGTIPMNITVINSGAAAIDANSYSIKIVDASNTATALYTIPGAEALPTLGDSHVYPLAASVYNEWEYPTTVGAMTLQAVLVFGQDSNENNNTATLSTYRRPTYDLAVASVTGPSIYPAAAPLGIVIENNGRVAVEAESYSVTVSLAGNVIYTAPTADIAAIAIAETHAIEVPAGYINPALSAVTGPFTLTIAVSSTDPTDLDDTNDTAPFASTRPYAGDAIVEVGIADGNPTPTTGNDGVLPFSVYRENTIAQSIYTPADLVGIEMGKITHIYYKFRRTDTYSFNLPLNIYMANSTKTSFSSNTDWEPYASFTLVKANFAMAPYTASGVHDIWIQLDTPFEYTGDNLIIMAHRGGTPTYDYTTDGFYQTTTVPDSNVSLYLANDTSIINVTNPGNGSRLHYKPQMRFVFTTGDFGVLSGNITDADGAVSGVNVTQVGGGSTISDGSGAYSLIVKRTSTADEVRFSKAGYSTTTYDASTATWTPGPTTYYVATHDASLATGADGDMSVVPLVTALKNNYPNPFNPTTTIAFDLARDGMVSIEVFNIKGQKVRTLTSEEYKVGSHRVMWNGDDSAGHSVGSGVYFYRMTTGGYSKTQKMLLLK